MPTEDKYNELLILGITGVIVLSVLTGLVVFILLFFQKKKSQHRQQLVGLEKQFSEELLRMQLELKELTLDAISQELHDNIGQVLSLATVQLNIAEQGGDFAPYLLAAKENIGRAMSDLRGIAHSLSTERIKFMDLAKAVGEELIRISKSGIMLTALQVYGAERDLDGHNKLIAFRGVQESLHNIIRHSGATEVFVAFFFEMPLLRIEIKDNGAGFDVESVTTKNGIGLRNMASRAALGGGKAIVYSSIGGGTTVTITIPYDR